MRFGSGRPGGHRRRAERRYWADDATAGGAVHAHHQVRVGVLFAAICVGFTLIAYRLVCLQVWWSPKFAEIASDQHRSKTRIEARRGSIFDCRGRVLATSERVRSVYAMPGQLQDPVEAVQALAPYLQESPRRLFSRLQGANSFVYLKRQVAEEVAARIEELQIPGIGLEPDDRRSYPNGSLASTLLGFVGVDSQGLDGLEYQHDDLLRGQPGWRVSTRDVYGRSLPALTRVLTEPKPGADLVLTIDQVVQYHLEQVLREVLVEQRAKSVTGVILDPRTGAILALASLPDFNPNEYRSARPAQRRNRAVTDVFEPGSVFKIVPAVTALEAGIVDASTQVYCEDGWYRYYGHVINDVHRLGMATFAEVIAESSNIGIVKVANQLAPETMHQQILAFGFGQRTGADLAGESPGLYRPPSKWSKLSMGALPIGQEIGVTPLQLATAYGAIANDGVRMRPYVIAEVRDASGRVRSRTTPVAVQRVCSPETARAVRHLFEGVVVSGTGQRARVPGYTVAGKTGTAQKTDPETGRYSMEDYVAVFAGMVPARLPRLVMVLVVDSPRKSRYGGQVAAPAFARIAAEVLQYLEVPPDQPQTPGTEPPLVLAAHPVESSELPPEDYLAAGMMPDLTGRTMRDVLTLLAPFAVRVDLEGSGLVVRQDPSPGEPLRPDMRCRITCSPVSA